MGGMTAGKKIHYLSIAILLSLAGVLIWWFSYSPSREITASIPGMDNKPANTGENSEVIDIGEGFESFDVTVEPDASAVWTRFRGPDSDNIYKSTVDIKGDWNENYPKLIWSLDLGEGHAAPAIYDGKVYLLDYDEMRRSDALRCISLADGKEVWRRFYRVNVKRNHGMSRTIPAVTDKFVLTIGPRCQVMCVDRVSGDLLWGLDLVREYGTEVPFWYTGQCPLIDGDVAIIAPGGSSMMIGVDCNTGEVLWKTPNPNKWKMSHSSVMPMTIGGVKMYVYAAVGGIVGVKAEGEDRGVILWETNVFKPNVVAPSPVMLDDGKIFLTAGYGAGSILFRVRKTGSNFDVQVIQEIKPQEGLACEQQTPIFYKGNLFGILPKDAGPNRNQFVCYNQNDITDLHWASGKAKRFGLGPYLVVDDKILILSDEGVLTMIKASVNGYEEIAERKILEGVDAWGPLALSGNRLLLRDSKRMVCVEL